MAFAKLFDFWQLELQGQVSSSMRANGLVYSLWSLLPSFCNYPLDTAENFKELEKALCSALQEEPDTRGIVCSSLQILIQQNKRIMEQKNEMPDLEEGTARQRAVSHYTPQVAADNLNALRSSAREFLNVLSGVFLQSTKDDGGSLQVLILSQLRILLHLSWSPGKQILFLSFFLTIYRDITCVCVCTYLFIYLSTFASEPRKWDKVFT